MLSKIWRWYLDRPFWQALVIVGTVWVLCYAALLYLAVLLAPVIG